MLLQVFGCLFLCLATDLTNQNDTFCVLVGQKHLQAVDEVGAVERIATDAHAQRLAEAHGGRLVHRLVGERAGAGHDTYSVITTARPISASIASITAAAANGGGT